MNAVIAESPAVLRWRQSFKENAVAALDNLLTESVYLGPFNRARPADALQRLLKPDEVHQADEAMGLWLQEHYNKPKPENLRGKRFTDALVEAFRAVVLLPLPQTRAWCAEHCTSLRIWLRQFYFGSSRDPESTLLVALAHGQANRKLLPLWLGIVKRGKPLVHVRTALMGLAQMPADDKGTVEHGLPKALLRGELEFAEALARHGDQKGKLWLDELDFLAAVYLIDKEQWGRQFRTVLGGREVSQSVRNWLNQRYPLAFKAGGENRGKSYLRAPHVDELRDLLPRIKTDYQGVRPQLQAFVERSRQYCRESGDSYYMARSFCNLGDQLIDHDPIWARELAHEAALWEPSNPYTWSLLAKALEAEGDWRRAEAVLWHARRRFPHDVYRHTELAHALLLHDQADLGEAVYREAIRLFPKSPVCWNDLANTLRTSGQRELAVQVYRQAQEHFNDEPVLNTALTDTLIDLGRLDEAEKALLWAEHVANYDDPKNKDTLDKIRNRLRLAKNGESLPPQRLRPYQEKPGGSLSALADISGIDLSQSPGLGRTSVWRRKLNGGLARARQELQNLPDSSAKLIETALLQAAEQDWRAAAGCFDAGWERYEGDGVLRVHRQRAHARAGDSVDWSWELQLYPDLSPVIDTEKTGQAPSLHFKHDEHDEAELGEEQRQDLWYVGLADLPGLRDVAEEDFLTARQLAC